MDEMARNQQEMDSVQEDLPEPPPQRTCTLPYQTFVTAQKPPPKTDSINTPIPVPIASLLQAAPIKSRPDITFNNINSIRSNGIRSDIIVNNMSPLTLNVSPIYSLPSSPNYASSPAISPTAYKYRNNRSISPYSPSLSPQGYQNKISPPLVQGRDPYLTNDMQPSPNFPQSNDGMMIDSTMPMLTNDFWSDSEMMQDNCELLTAFDDVKLI